MPDDWDDVQTQQWKFDRLAESDVRVFVMCGVPRDLFEEVHPRSTESLPSYRITVEKLWRLGWRPDDDGSLQPPERPGGIAT